MKFAQTFAVAVVGGILLSFAINTQAQSKPAYVTITRIQGEARYSNDGSVWHALTVGQALGAGAVIQTAADSLVDLVLGDRVANHINPHPEQIASAADGAVRGMVSSKALAEQNAIRMFPDTVLAVDKLLAADTGADAMSDTELDLRQGKIFGNVKKLSAASQFLVKMPNGIAGVRGTVFFLSANGDVTVVGGSVVVSVKLANGQTHTAVLGPGDQFNPSTGQVTRLTGRELLQVVRTAVEITAKITTVEAGILRYASDVTSVNVSPYRGTGPPRP